MLTTNIIEDCFQVCKVTKVMLRITYLKDEISSSYLIWGTASLDPGRSQKIFDHIFMPYDTISKFMQKSPSYIFVMK